MQPVDLLRINSHTSSNESIESVLIEEQRLLLQAPSKERIEAFFLKSKSHHFSEELLLLFVYCQLYAQEQKPSLSSEKLFQLLIPVVDTFENRSTILCKSSFFCHLEWLEEISDTLRNRKMLERTGGEFFVFKEIEVLLDECKEVFRKIPSIDAASGDSTEVNFGHPSFFLDRKKTPFMVLYALCYQLSFLVDKKTIAYDAIASFSTEQNNLSQSRIQQYLGLFSIIDQILVGMSQECWQKIQEPDMTLERWIDTDFFCAFCQKLKILNPEKELLPLSPVTGLLLYWSQSIKQSADSIEQYALSDRQRAYNVIEENSFFEIKDLASWQRLVTSILSPYCLEEIFEGVQEALFRYPHLQARFSDVLALLSLVKIPPEKLSSNDLEEVKQNEMFTYFVGSLTASIDNADVLRFFLTLYFDHDLDFITFLGYVQAPLLSGSIEVIQKFLQSCPRSKLGKFLLVLHRKNRNIDSIVQYALESQDIDALKPYCKKHPELFFPTVLFNENLDQAKRVMLVDDFFLILRDKIISVSYVADILSRLYRFAEVDNSLLKMSEALHLTSSSWVNIQQAPEEAEKVLKCVCEIDSRYATTLFFPFYKKLIIELIESIRLAGALCISCSIFKMLQSYYKKLKPKEIEVIKFLTTKEKLLPVFFPDDISQRLHFESDIKKLCENYIGLTMLFSSEEDQIKEKKELYRQKIKEYPLRRSVSIAALTRATIKHV